MKLNNAHADILVPDGLEPAAALARTTHLGIGAHQDDLELCMPHGPLECFGRRDRWYTGVTCTDGAGSPRAGLYADCSDEDMKRVRLEEQRTAARIGRYSTMLQLGYSSGQIKAPGETAPVEDLRQILDAARPEVVYTHNPADKHATHVAVFMVVLNALRALPPEARPQRVLGCEAWRGLDWLPDARKVLLELDGRDNLRAALSGVYDSQIAGGKRYDAAVAGRYHANATFLESHAVDTSTACLYAMDLTPLAADPELDVTAYVTGLMRETEAAIVEQIGAFE